MLPTRRIRSTQTQWTMHAQKTYALSSDAASRSASQGKGTSSACIRTPSGGGAAPLLCVAETVVESPGAPGRAIWRQWRGRWIREAAGTPAASCCLLPCGPASADVQPYSD